MSGMIGKFYKFTMFIFAISVIVSFFLPWISVNTQPVGKVTTVLISKDDASFTKISGFRIPILAGSEDVRLIVSIARIFNPSLGYIKFVLYPTGGALSNAPCIACDKSIGDLYVS